MKILYIDQPLEPPGGGQISLMVLLENLDKEKFQFKVFIPYKCQFFEMLKEKKIDAEIVPLSSFYKKIKEFLPDIIHCNAATTKYTFFASAIAKFMNIPFIWHNRVVENAGWKEKLIAKLSTKIIVISDKVAEKFNDFRNKIVKIYNPVDNEKFKPELDNKYLYFELNISENDKVVGIFSRLDWWKGHKLAIDAFRKLTKEFENVKLLIAGEGPYKKEIVNYAKHSGVYEKILFLGFRKDIPQLMNICDIILNPSTQPEPFGRTIIEAMTLGKPVIASNLGGPGEIINHMVDGILVNPDSEELKKYIILLLTDKELYKKISASAKEKSKMFSIEGYIKKIESLYNEVTQI